MSEIGRRMMTSHKLMSSMKSPSRWTLYVYVSLKLQSSCQIPAILKTLICRLESVVLTRSNEWNNPACFVEHIKWRYNRASQENQALFVNPMLYFWPELKRFSTNQTSLKNILYLEHYNQKRITFWIQLSGFRRCFSDGDCLNLRKASLLVKIPWI